MYDNLAQCYSYSSLGRLLDLHSPWKCYFFRPNTIATSAGPTSSTVVTVKAEIRLVIYFFGNAKTSRGT